MVLHTPDFISKMFSLIQHTEKAVRKEAFWTVSNITAGSAEQIEHILAHPSFVEKIVEAVTNDAPEVPAY